jgi:hypothetical protein
MTTSYFAKHSLTVIDNFENRYPWSSFKKARLMLELRLLLSRYKVLQSDTVSISATWLGVDILGLVSPILLATKALRESTLFLDFGTRRGVRGQRHVPAAFYPQERPSTHCPDRPWVRPRAGLYRCGKSRPHRNSIPGRPSRSQSLYRLSYPGPPVDHNLYT